MKLQTTSSTQTKKIAKELAGAIIGKTKKTNRFLDFFTTYDLRHKTIVITFNGNLGAGKTTFIQGFLRGLGVKSKITSPTFVIVKSYKVKSYKVFHMDAYRIKSPKEILDLNWKEIISDPKNIILIEWPERITGILPKDKINISLKYGKRENERELIIY